MGSFSRVPPALRAAHGTSASARCHRALPGPVLPAPNAARCRCGRAPAELPPPPPPPLLLPLLLLRRCCCHCGAALLETHGCLCGACAAVQEGTEAQAPTCRQAAKPSMLRPRCNPQYEIGCGLAADSGEVGVGGAGSRSTLAGMARRGQLPKAAWHDPLRCETRASVIGAAGSPALTPYLDRHRWIGTLIFSRDKLGGACCQSQPSLAAARALAQLPKRPSPTCSRPCCSSSMGWEGQHCLGHPALGGWPWPAAM